MSNKTKWAQKRNWLIFILKGAIGRLNAHSKELRKFLPPSKRFIPGKINQMTENLIDIVERSRYEDYDA